MPGDQVSLLSVWGNVEFYDVVYEFPSLNATPVSFPAYCSSCWCPARAPGRHPLWLRSYGHSPSLARQRCVGARPVSLSLVGVPCFLFLTAEIAYEKRS